MRDVWPPHLRTERKSRSMRGVWAQMCRVERKSRSVRGVWPPNRRAERKSRSMRGVWPPNRRAEPKSRSVRGVWPPNRRAERKSRSMQTDWPWQRDVGPACSTLGTLRGPFERKKVRTTPVLTCDFTGASYQTRTDDPRFTRGVRNRAIAYFTSTNVQRLLRKRAV